MSLKEQKRIEAVLQRTRQRKARFDAAHHKAMKSLAEGDYDALGEAIQEEGAAIEDQAPATNKRQSTPTTPKRKRR